jgi:hypothetical protein
MSKRYTDSTNASIRAVSACLVLFRAATTDARSLTLIKPELQESSYRQASCDSLANTATENAEEIIMTRSIVCGSVRAVLLAAVTVIHCRHVSSACSLALQLLAQRSTCQVPLGTSHACSRLMYAHTTVHSNLAPSHGCVYQLLRAH